MSKIPNSRSDPRPKYNQEDIQTIENVSSGKNAVDILLDEWGTSGRKRPTLQDLADILRTDEEFTRHSQFLNHELTRDLDTDFYFKMLNFAKFFYPKRWWRFNV